MRLSGSAGVRPNRSPTKLPAAQGPGIVSRRSLLLAGAAVPLAGCDVFGSSPTPAATPTPPHPDEVVRERAAASERELVALYMAAAAMHPALGPDLERFADRHLRHVTAVEATAPSPTPGVTPTPSTVPETPSAPDVPTDPGDAVRMLRDAEIAAVQARREDCLSARDAPLATTLASIAACEAAHDRLLRNVA